MPYEILDAKTLHDGWSTLSALKIRMPDGRLMKREVEDHGAAVGMLPYDSERRVAMLIRQFRAPVLRATGEADLLEAPAGLLDEDNPEDCARREAMEEVGLRLTSLEPVGAVWTMPGISTERMHLYLAPYGAADRVAEGGGLASEHEEITIVEMPLAELARMADAGELTDMKALLLVQTLRLRRPDLF
jgi:nudix-type nucleoside diphosphatase (YffH/AdpP family)